MSIPVETPLAHSSSSSYAFVLDASGTGAVNMPDAGLMFRGTFARSGPDLTITGPEGQKALVVDYFSHEQPPTLMSPAGAILDGQLVVQLAGSRFGGQFAQVAPGVQAAPVGLVETVAGSVTITHADGTRVTAAAGTAVFEGDVIQTAADGRLSITFSDKTVASLGESARLVVDKFVYDAGGSQNSMLLNLVQGAFVFVAGLVAPTGDMKVQTPVATMGIRGTTGVVRADVQDGTSYFTLKPDPPGKLGESGGHIGAFDVFARLSGVLIKEVRLPDQLLVVRSAAGQFEDIPQVGSNESAFQQEILNFAFAAHQQMLIRTEGQQPDPNRRGDINPDGTRHAGLDGNSDTATFFREPLNVDLVKQTVTLPQEDFTQGQQSGGTNGSTIQAPGLLSGPTFINDPIAVLLGQEGAEPGIHGTFPVLFTGNGGPVSIVKVVTTVTAVSINEQGVATPFSLTPDQIAALARAYDPATGKFDLSIDTKFLGADQQIVITIGITIADSQGRTATQTEAFSIHGSNDAVVIEANSRDASAQTAGGTTQIGSDGTITLHPVGDAPGALWQPVSLVSDAHWSLKAFFGSGMQTGADTGRADGIAFVFQADGPQAIGGGGGGLGIEGLHSAFGVKFDTYQNGGEPAYHFAQFFVADAAGHITYFTPPGGLPNLGVLNDNQWHNVTIDWNAATHTLTYTITAGSVVTSGSFVMPDSFTMPTNAQVYGGFTGSGGAETGAVQIQLDAYAGSNATSGVLKTHTGVPGQTEAVNGQFAFSDPDVSDKHVVDVARVGADGPPPQGIFTATMTSDANGHGTVKWTYAIDSQTLASLGHVNEVYRVSVSDGRSTSSVDVHVTLQGGGYGDGPMPHNFVSLSDDVISQVIQGGDADDTIQLDLAAHSNLKSYIDGGRGENALHLLGQAATIDLTALGGHVRNITGIDLMQQGQNLNLSLASVLDMTSAPTWSLLQGVQSVVANASAEHILVVDHANLQPGSNTLDLQAPSGAGQWVDTGATVASLASSAAANASGSSYHIYNFVSSDSSHHVLATIAVQSGIDVHGAVHPVG